ncbi:helix-turn-helix domain-containing protein [Streptomyces lonegramiae]|uniref:Helix-turn-helix domain-containing protein n=1 Tax=Streptomyces lonegramiae TaxID=3075524 RepID=A0ABU2XUF3_9ACTN|nr:helix-turn-helix domain-containing protein [Streptomyces sp. DSM 41529]MDT0549541.1 helix-turn-helix domain-containing protein [Streptomyces sp. DSM 41529]
MAQPVMVRRLTEAEGQKLQRIVRRGSTSTVRFRRATMLLASAGGNSVPVIARLVQAAEDTVRDVIHKFNEVGLACLDPRWAGGRPRLLTDDDEDFVIQTATTRPTKLGKPFTRWSIRKLADHLRRNIARPIRIGREALRCLLVRRGITFQRTKTWKESNDPDFDAKLDRIEYALKERPDRTFAFDEFGPLGIRPTAGSCWAEQGRPNRLPATKLCFTPTNASWANPIEAHFGPLRQFTLANSNHPHHTVQTRALHRYLRWRNANARHPDVLTAQRRERARIRREKGIRWGRLATSRRRLIGHSGKAGQVSSVA